MTNNEIDNAIAEAVGWKLTVDGGICWDGEGNAIITPPAYSYDLNAMREAEMFLVGLDDGRDSGCARYLYSRTLYSVVVPFNQQPFMATARQRAEAFLRTIGKWRDE